MFDTVVQDRFHEGAVLDLFAYRVGRDRSAADHVARFTGMRMPTLVGARVDDEYHV